MTDSADITDTAVSTAPDTQREELPLSIHQVEPSMKDYLKFLAESISKSGMVGVNNPYQGVIVAHHCYVHGISHLDFAAQYHIVKSKVSMRADQMAARFNEAGGSIRWDNLGDDGQLASATFSYLDEPDKKIHVEYTIEDAKREGLVKSGSRWVKDPGSMLRARATTKGIRIVAPQVIAGLYSPEELDSVPAPKEPAAAVVESSVTETTTKAVESVTTSPAPSNTTEGVEADFSTVTPATPEQCKQIMELAKSLGISREQFVSIMQSKYGVSKTADLTSEDAIEAILALKKKQEHQDMKTELDEWATNATVTSGK